MWLAVVWWIPGLYSGSGFWVAVVAVVTGCLYAFYVLEGLNVVYDPRRRDRDTAPSLWAHVGMAPLPGLGSLLIACLPALTWKTAVGLSHVAGHTGGLPLIVVAVVVAVGCLVGLGRLVYRSATVRLRDLVPAVLAVAAALGGVGWLTVTLLGPLLSRHWFWPVALGLLVLGAFAGYLVRFAIGSRRRTDLHVRATGRSRTPWT